jgi:hypothetical protein
MYKRTKRPHYADERTKSVNKKICLYLQDRIKELKFRADSNVKINNDYVNDNPWSFIEAVSFIDFLATHVNNKKSTGTIYKDFIKTYMYPNNEPIIFANNKKCKLSDIIWNILRCGGLHNFSFCPYDWEDKIENNDFYRNTIILTNRKNKSKKKHKDIVKINLNDNKTQMYEGIIIVAEDFVEDIELAVNTIIKQFNSHSNNYKDLKQKLKDSFETCPPIGWYHWR